MKQAWIFLGLTGGVLLYGAATQMARAADLVVLDAQGLALKAGDVVDVSKRLDLDEGQQVTLVTDDGDTIKLRGPFHQAPSARSGGGNSVTVALAGLLVQKDVRTGDVGVVRELTALEPPDPWAIDISPAGNRCLRDGEPVIFRRKTSMVAAQLSIASSDGSWRETTAWPKGATKLSAPAKLPSSERAGVILDLGEGPVTITLLTIPATMKNDRMRAAWMFEAGCDLQATTLARTIK
jgi:hypothetical protein